MGRLRSRLAASMVVATSIIVACKYTAPDGVAPTDGAAADAPPILPDAGPCEGSSVACFTSGSDTVLQTCAGVGEQPVIDTCVWGCVSTGTPHCGVLQPSGGAVLPEHVLPTTGQTLLDITVTSGNPSFNSDTGEISDGIRAAGEGVDKGIEFIVRNNVGIFRFKSLTINDEITVDGVNGVAFVALESIAVNEDVDLRDCSVSTRAQGGFVGGGPGQDGGGPDDGNGGEGGQGQSNDSSGGGGGAYAGSGGSGGGGNNEGRTNGGDVFGTDVIMILQGGAGGGGGGNVGGRGGNGGGAIQLVAGGAITFSNVGTINAGGCGGQAGQNGRAAGGGGAGGAILLEARTIVMAGGAILAVNGGGGGGGDSSSLNGGNGNTSLTRASGGTGGGSGGDGGEGAANDEFTGENGVTDRNGGGGGGGVGWIRLHTKSGAATLDAATIFSPIMVTGSPASQGLANVQ